MDNKPFEDSIPYPFKGKNDPNLGPVAVLVSNQEDLDLLRGLMGLSKHRKLLMSSVYLGNHALNRLSIAGPLIGAPYAVMVLENLIAWGARHFLFFGWCGAISRKVKIGDIIVPTSAIIDEGTSKHYATNPNLVVKPSASVLKTITTSFNQKNIDFHKGLIWTTDAIYRETGEKVEYYQKKNVLAVEMEASALFTVGKFRNVETGCILAVSDELSTFHWHRGFHNKRFIKNRRAVLEVIIHLCKNISIRQS
ncbi:MAG: nucleoside phosphorylase [Desulfobacterales bacterium]|nr:MAG: nucleoside phosphorylase [Desulfobacterales bacterium]